ncbi:hypothetical protein SDC9_180566 [bioreactor metagenome]|uniref:VOC domain-containing protein n=1 Tax=bioreactor metagenome TaxID=1076179 RepID=A0A645HBB1_9ZZZZ|nr:VOC family protein [Lachnospiraceae bacterium]
MMPGIKNPYFHHVALYSKDIDKTIDFYTKGLGLTLFRKWGDKDNGGAMIKIGSEGMLEVFTKGTKESELNARYNHFAIYTQDIDYAYDLAIKAGAKPSKPPFSVEIPAEEPFKVYVAFVKGPDDEEIEFYSEV